MRYLLIYLILCLNLLISGQSDKNNDEFLLFETILQKWTDNSWENKWKDYNIYDNGNLIESYGQGWRDTNWAEPGHIDINIYDTKNNKIEHIFQINENGIIRNEIRNLYSYNSNNYLIDEQSQVWSDSIGWENLNRRMYSYDQQNNLIEETHLGWVSDDWKEARKYTYIYNTNNKLIEEQFSDYYAPRFNKTHLYYYNNRGLLEDIHHFRMLDSVWSLTNKYSYKYDENENLIEELNSSLDDLDSTWNNIWLKKYEYDERNNNTEYYRALWHSTSWDTTNWDSYKYDVFNNRIEYKRRGFENNSWQNRNKTVFKYDENNNLISNTSMEWYTSDWNNTSRNLYSYVRTTTDIENEKIIPNFELSQNYPNPFNPTTTIKYSIPSNSYVTLKVFDVLGSEVKTLVDKELQHGSYEIKFDGSVLSSGIYLYELKSDGYRSIRKMLLLK